MSISGLFLALLHGLDAINPVIEHYMNFSTARPLLNTYEDILNIGSSELKGDDVQVQCCKRYGL